MGVTLADALEVLTPAGVPRVHYLVSDEMDGQGPRITFWDTGTLGTQPTPAQLAAVTQGEVDTARTAKLRAAAIARYEDEHDRDAKGWRALALLAMDENNILRKSYPLPVLSITRAGTVATVTTRWPHLLTSGQVTIHGADVAAYNGAVTITVTGASTFTYAVAGSPATPAVGSITCFPRTAALPERTVGDALQGFKNKLNSGGAD